MQKVWRPPTLKDLNATRIFTMGKKKEEDWQKVLEEVRSILADPEEAERRFNLSVESYLRRNRRRRAT